MASLDEIRRAGLDVSATPVRNPEASAGASIASFISGLSNWKVSAENEAQKTAKLQKEQYDFYNTLRTNGLSPEEATAKVNSVYNKDKGLLPRIFDKQNALNSFQQPKGQDAQAKEEETRQAELASKRATTAKTQAETDRYKKQGSYTDSQMRDQRIGKTRALSMIQSGKYFTAAGDEMDIADADEMKARVAKLKDVDPNDPEIKKAIKQKFVPNFNSDLYDFVQNLKEKGHSDEEISRDLKGKGINPEDYLG